MKKITLNCLTLVFISLLATRTTLAQDLLFKIPLSKQVQSSTQIIEGKVIHQASFWDVNHQNIYTSNTIEVYKVFKGQSLATVEIITPGGTVGLQSEVVTPSLQLSKNDVGLFMLHNSSISLDENRTSTQAQFSPYASVQGFYKYNIDDDIAANPLNATQGITSSLYPKITGLTHSNYTNVKAFDVDEENRLNNSINTSRGSAYINDFSPTTVTGGTKTTITINGAGFGTAGVVGFRDANYGGEDDMGSPVYYNCLPTEVVSWSSTQIVVEVPSRAGTGDIKVIPTAGGGSASVSSQTLTVTYSEINLTYDPGTGDEMFMTQHINKNGNGGYIWQMQTDFDANTAAKESFIRAFDTWVCETGINWEIGTTTTTDVIADDDINIIRFDNGAELPDGVLGRCTSRFGGCSSGGNLHFYVKELDIVFNDVFTGDLSVLSWEYGPDTATGYEVDFQSVAVHELGHGHQLAHVINSGQIMHYSLANGQNSRALSGDDIDAGNDVQSRSVTTPVCGFGLMTNSTCSTLKVNDAVLAENISVYPNPAKDKLNIKNNTNMTLNKVIVYDVTGKLILKLDMSQNNRLSSFDVSNLQSGMYFLNISTDTASITKKFVIE